MLELHNADVDYGKARVLHGLSLQLRPSRVLALVGRNGAGKTTTLKALMGLLPLKSGQRLLDDRDLRDVPLHQCSREGIALVPEDRQIFSGLSCRENLEIAGLGRQGGRWDCEAVFRLFPRLRERAVAQGTALSGGEQQMLAIGRALMTNPRYLLLDEPTEGLAPVIVDQIVAAIGQIASEGTGIALVEQNFSIPRRLAIDFILIDGGRAVWSGGPDDVTADLEDLLAGLSSSPSSQASSCDS